MLQKQVQVQLQCVIFWGIAMRVLLLQASSIVQELSEYYRQLADGSSIFCMDTDVSLPY